MNAPFHLAEVIAAQAAARLNLTRGRDGAWRGHCPCCHYAKPSLTISARKRGVGISCVTCGDVRSIASIAGVPLSLLAPDEPQTAKIERALALWKRSLPAQGTSAEEYLRERGIDIPVPPSIRYLPRQRNWADGAVYPAMIALVEREPESDETGQAGLLSSGIHLTFLSGPDHAGVVRKAATVSSKLTLGQLRQGGVWLTPHYEVGSELAVTEGIETGLSVRQITGVPTVAALSAAGMRAFHWPRSIRRLWIAADNDDAGIGAAKALTRRALDAGLDARIKIPARSRNDFNDLLLETK